MKKLFAVLLFLIAAFAYAQQNSAPPVADPRIPGSFPKFVRLSLRNVPKDVLVGIGSSNLDNFHQARTVSTARARGEIARQLSAMVQDMVRDYADGSEADPSAVLSFQENFTSALSKSALVGSIVVEQDIVDGVVWTVVWIGKADAVNEINYAQAAARLAVPSMASFRAEDRMNLVFTRQAAQPFHVRSD
jgi:hypothetical protein